MKSYGVSVISYGYLSIEAESEEKALKIAKTLRKSDFEYPDSYPDDDELQIVDVFKI